MNDLIRGHFDLSALPENKALLTDIKRLETELADRQKWNTVNPLEKQAYRDEMIHKIQTDHWARCQAKKEAVSDELGKFAAAWKRDNQPDAAERLLKLERYKAQISLMNPKDLKQKISEAASADTPEARSRFSPEWLTAATAEAAKMGGDTRFAAGVALQNCHAEAPWLNTEQGAALSELAQAYDMEYGQAALGPEDDGNGAIGRFDVAEVVA